MRKCLAATVVVLGVFFGGVVHAQSGAASPASLSLAAALGLTPQAPLPATQSCIPIPDPPKPVKYTCGNNSSPSFCDGKAVGVICGTARGYCAYCWQVSGTPDDLGNLPCNCRNNVSL